MSVTAVILNWETPAMTERAARALLENGVDGSRIVIVDNGSRDGSAGALSEALPAVRILALEENRGFAAGNNAGAEALPADVYLFVNSDAFAQAGAVDALVAALQGRVGLAVPRLQNEDGSHQPNVVPPTTLARELLRSSGLSRFFNTPAWSTHWAHDRARAIDCAIGAVVAVRADAWDDLGGFDERRFMYAEDLDLFWRARNRGWTIWFEPRSRFVHVGGATAARRWTSATRAAAVASAEAEMIRAHTPPLAAGATLAVMAVGSAARAVVRRAVGQRAAAAALAAFARGYARGALRLE